MNEKKEKEAYMTELKPCPFCGNAFPTLSAQHDLCFVRCEKCKTIGGVARDKEQSVKAWNKRYSIEEVEYLRQLKEFLKRR